jgi:hypothetical protein
MPSENFTAIHSLFEEECHGYKSRPIYNLEVSSARIAPKMGVSNGKHGDR